MSVTAWRVIVFVCGGCVLFGSPPAPQSVEFFEKRVRPVLARNCYSCHGPDKQYSSLRLDSRARALQGGKTGPAIVAGKPDDSLLIKAVRHEGLKMPVGGKLKDEEIADLAEWVRMGAPWPEDAPARAGAGDPAFYDRLIKEHWAFQPVKAIQPPAVKNQTWSENPVDRFILAALEKASLKPSAPSDRRTLIRRLSFILTGLPPAAAEIEQFAADRSPDAYTRLVDRILASPNFGEHWARHWLDVMRFGETYGYEWNYELHGAWRYRDYLIRAFNQDVPYDQLIREHIAGDLLDKPRLNAKDGINESIIGTSSFRLGEMGHDDCLTFREIRTDVVDNQIDTLTKAFQGLTVACARCHDHKLDPIPTEDYYALYGILTSARQVTRTIDLTDVAPAEKQKMRNLKSEIRREIARIWMQESGAIGRDLAAAQSIREGAAAGQEALTPWVTVLQKDSAGLEDPLAPWFEAVSRMDGQPARWQQVWREVAGHFERESRERAAFNAQNFLPFADFGGGFAAGWSADGLGLRDGASHSGEFSVAANGDGVISAILPAGLYTDLISDKLNGALRSPFLPKDKKFVSLQMLGGELAARRTITDNCMLGEDYELLDQPAPKWRKWSTSNDRKQLPVYLELVTRSDNPRLPDRPDRMKGVKTEQMLSPRSYFGVTRAVLHDVDEPPRASLSHLKRLFEGGKPASLEEFASRYAAICRQAISAWLEDRATDDDVRWLDWLARNRLLGNSKTLSPRLSELVDAYRVAEAGIAEPRVVNGMTDVDPGYDFPVLKSGDPKSPGAPVPRHYLKVLGQAGALQTAGSGRREVAELIASAGNPLTSRVMVNRIWHYVFGRGLVTTVDNFGRFGDTPSHPELLDYLADRFVKQGWSVKGLIRELVLSKAFQQASLAPAAAAEIDPQNRLLSHYPVRRLDAESIRDAVLATSGRLDRTLYGPSLQPYRELTKEYRKLLAGPLDGNGRRSVYIKVTRMEGPLFLELFDFPIPSVTRGERDVTNVPAQALALLNDPFVIDQAKFWADRLIADRSDSAESRIDSMFRQALGRAAEPDERERLRGLAYEVASLQGVPRGEIMRNRNVWKDVAHAVFNLKEFIYVR